MWLFLKFLISVIGGHCDYSPLVPKSVAMTLNCFMFFCFSARRRKVQASSRVCVMLLVKVHAREVKPEKRTPKKENESFCNSVNIKIKLLKLLLYLWLNTCIISVVLLYQHRLWKIWHLCSGVNFCSCNPLKCMSWHENVKIYSTSQVTNLALQAYIGSYHLGIQIH